MKSRYRTRVCLKKTASFFPKKTSPIVLSIGLPTLINQLIKRLRVLNTRLIPVIGSSKGVNAKIGGTHPTHFYGFMVFQDVESQFCGKIIFLLDSESFITKKT